MKGRKRTVHVSVRGVSSGWRNKRGPGSEGFPNPVEYFRHEEIAAVSVC